jgi:excisionase family DNA binding protein
MIPKLHITEEGFESPDYEQSLEKSCQAIAQLLYKYHLDKETKKHKRLLDIDQIVDRLNISKNTVYSWVYQKKIPYIKLGRNVRFDPEKIERWLKSKEVAEYARK